MLPSRLQQFLIVSISLASVIARPELATSEQPQDKFHELLKDVSEESLHAVLHEHLHPKYQDGVYEDDRSALERLHNDDPSLASRLLSSAHLSASRGGHSRLELLRRQNATIPPPPASSEPPPVVIPIEIPSTNAAGSSIVVTTSAVAQASASVAVEVTQPNGQVATSIAPAVVVSSTDAAGSVRVTTSAVPQYTPPAVQVATTTDAQGKTFVTTFTPSGDSISSMVLSTTTLPDGSRSTVTRFTVAGAGRTPAGDAGAQATNKNNPSLQKGAAGDLKSRSLKLEAIVLFAGAMGVACLL